MQSDSKKIDLRTGIYAVVSVLEIYSVYTSSFHNSYSCLPPYLILLIVQVCTYESLLAGLHRLKRLGITRLAHLTGPTQLAALSSAMNQLPDEAIALAAASHIERELQITPWNLTANFVACTSQVMHLLYWILLSATFLCCCCASFEDFLQYCFILCYCV